ncbi:MAG: dTMP kinase [Clostridia bacterium]|jgi:dTMP kinase|nr:dTMP kinase [Clostridia bacterium]
MKGFFITFEGCEGSGKSTQTKLLSEYLEKKYIPYILTREPGGNVVSENIRVLIKDMKNQSMINETEILLFAAARAQHTYEKILPALNEGKIVICDRYFDSTYAYQGYARGVKLSDINNINKFSTFKLIPDVTFFLDITPTDAFLQKGAPDKDDRLEQTGIEFHEKVYAGYKELIKHNKKRIVVIPAYKRAPLEISLEIINILKKRNILGD